MLAALIAQAADAQTGWQAPSAASARSAVDQAAVPSFGSAGFSEGFEGPNPSWTEAGSDVNYRLQQHRRAQGAGRSGRGCEWLQIQGDGGSVVYFGHEAGRPRVIDELRVMVWIKSDRPGLQFIAEIALPHSIDPQTGRPMVALVHGGRYTAVGHWQQLEVTDLPRLLARQVRSLRSQTKANIEPRDAYLNRALLNIYGGPGVTSVWIDDLEVSGFVRSPPEVINAASTGSAVQPAGTERNGDNSPDAPPRPVELAGSVLTVYGRPLLPRVIEYQGERLQTLKQLGFNAIRFRQSPTRELLGEAQRLGLWLVCPPPRVGQVFKQSNQRQDEGPANGQGQVENLSYGPEFQSVLAWDLGEGLTGDQLETVRQWAQSTRTADARQGRPLICSPSNNLRGYSRYVDLLLIDRRPLGTSLEMPDYGVWVRRQPLLARPGTPVWTTVQTQPSETLRRQLVALEPDRPLPGAASPEQIRLLVYTAISCGSRGLVFQSQSPLDADDAETRQRAMALQLLNLELEIIEPWVAAGSFTTTAETSQAQVTGAVLRSDRARLVLPAWSALGSQCVAPAAAVSSLAMVVPGVPESASAYELTGGRVQPIRPKRVAGGMRMTLDDFSLAGLVFLAQDPLVIDAVTRRATVNGKLSAELERHLAAQRLRSVTGVVQQIEAARPASLAARFGMGGARGDQQLAAARQSVQWCDAQLAAGDYLAAAGYARRAMSSLRTVERSYWEAAVSGGSPAISPATASFATLPWHWNLVRRMAGALFGPNRLPGGDFEDLDTMMRSGWRHCQYTSAGVHAAADLVAEAAHSGRRGLRLTARADDPEHPPAMLETPPVWISSPAVPVEAGQVVRIHGWVRIPSPISGSVDGLLVIDSLTGEDMAERLDNTKGWREFTLYRAAPRSGPMTVTFLLSGLGEARLDDVGIEVLSGPREPRGN